jgi:hypothetical protein
MSELLAEPDPDMTYLVQTEVIEDSERMYLSVEHIGVLAQLHFHPRKWSHNWFKKYKEILDSVCEQLAEQGVEVLVEGMLMHSTHRIKFIKMFGFNEKHVNGICILYRDLTHE